jgi:hypothetical protein
VDSQGHTILRKKDAADTIANQSLYEAQSSVALSYQDSEGASHTVLFADSSGIVDPFIFKGVLNCSANPNYPAADAGHVYKVSVAGKIGGASGKAVTAGDTLYCFTDSSAAGNEATVGANWAVLQVNISEIDYVRNHVYYVDGSRTDSYTADGSIYRPYTTIKAAQDAINVVSATLLGSAANFELCKFIVKIAPGKYTDNIAISTARYIRYDMEGVEISGNITITQNQVGLTDYYGKVEFFGGHGNRAYRGNCGLISGNITFLKDAYDSLAYDAFIGIHISGNVQYGTSSAATHGTWVLCLINSYFSSSSKYISEYLTDPTEGVLIESYGYNKILSKLAKQDDSATKITLYDCNNTYFGTVNITPTENGIVKNCTFNTTTSIVATKTLYLDSNSHKSLLARTPTVTGMTLTGLDMGMAHQEANAVAITGGTINSTAIGGTTPAAGAFSTLVIPEKTPVNAVAASGVLTSDNTDVADGATVTIGEIVYRFKDTMAQAYDVKRTGTADDTLANLVHAINGTGSAGVNYYEGTVAHTLVTSGDVSSHAITVTAKTKGVAGDSIAKAEDSDHLDWDETGEYFTGGVDGTVGVANELCANATYLYHCIATNTIADDNWRQIALGSAY